MTQDHQIRIGELLVSAGILSEDMLNQRMKTAKQLGMPLGQILVASNDVEKSVLSASLKVQSLLLEGLMSAEVAANALKYMVRDKIELEDALYKAGFSDHDALAYRLGDILIAAGLISDDDLAWGLLTSGEIAIPLGHALIQTGVVKPEVVAAALVAQRQIRTKSVPPDEAIDLLKSFVRD